MIKLAIIGMVMAALTFWTPVGPSLDLSHPSVDTVEGSWIGEFRTHRWQGVSESLWISLRARTDRERHGYSFHIPLKDLDGLSIAPGNTGDSQVQFTLPREAGRFVFEGQFRRDTGSGAFVFTTSDDYVRAMDGLGYGSLSTDEVFMLGIHDVTTGFVEELQTLGYADLSFDDLVAMTIHGATPDFIREMQALGYDGLDPDELVAMRIHGVSPRYIRDLADLGYDNVPLRKVVEMRIHGVSIGYVRELKELGYQPSVDKLIEMKIHGISPKFVKAMKGN